MDTPMNKWIVAIISSIILLAACTVLAKAENIDSIRDGVRKLCQGKFKNKQLTPAELIMVVNEHRAWISASGKKIAPLTQKELSDPRRANLCGARLSEVDLSCTNLWNANLSGADLSYANLSGANLIRADLTGADLAYVNLSDANLMGADLSGADLLGANLKNTELTLANLRDVMFQVAAIPEVYQIAHAENLELMFYIMSPEALMQLRKAFKESGFYDQERRLTYAIKHCETVQLIYEGHWKFFDGVFRYVFFDRTTFWGMAPGQALQILLVLILVFAIPYIIVLRLPGMNGIWRKWSDDRMRTDLGTEVPERLNTSLRQALMLGLYFSVLSAFNIGWRDLSLGSWIQRLQTKEYTLRATGWVRTVSGIQSLISVYLLAICVLTYFGRPFE